MRSGGSGSDGNGRSVLVGAIAGSRSPLMSMVCRTVITLADRYATAQMANVNKNKRWGFCNIEQHTHTGKEIGDD